MILRISPRKQFENIISCPLREKRKKTLTLSMAFPSRGLLMGSFKPWKSPQDLSILPLQCLSGKKDLDIILNL